MYTNFSLTNPIFGQRPNAPLETWNRLKKATAELRSKESDSSILESQPVANLVENGPNGEILLWFSSTKVCEVWDWGPEVKDLARYSSPIGTSIFTEPSGNLAEEYTGDSLNLVSSFYTGPEPVLAMTVFPTSFGKLLILLQETSSRERFGKVYCRLECQTLSLTAQLTEGTLNMKASQEYLIVSSSKGYLNIFKSGTPSQLLQNLTGEPLTALEHCTRPVLAQDCLDESKIKSAFVKTLVAGDLPIYDIVGSWLVYSPTQVECNYFKKLHQSRQNIPKRGKFDGYTPMKLPSSGPLLARVLSALSSSAADTLLSLSELSSRAVRKSKNIIEKDISLKSVSSSIGNTIYNTANAMYTNSGKLVKPGGESQLVKIIDLSGGNTIALFKAPGGVSHLSLNEYDLQLAHANARGDSIYLWDLYKLPKEVSLVGNFQRGKTSARIREMVWFMSNSAEEGTTVSNFGLGCITERSGSIHWFHINYLFSGKERENYPNVRESNGRKIGAGANGKRAINDQFLNVWTLPSLGAVKFMKLPTYANVPEGVKRSEFKNAYTRDVFSRLNQLAYVDGGMNVRLISTLNGKHNFKYMLPTKSHDELPDRAARKMGSGCGPLLYRGEAAKLEQEENPISQAEIETCEPYVTFIQNENRSLAVYDIGETAGDTAAFWDQYAMFGTPIAHVTRDFRPVSHSAGASHPDETRLKA